MSNLRIGINGLGRIGRLLFREIFDSGGGALSIAAVNGRSPAEMAAHLIQHDSVHGVWGRSVRAGEAAGGGKALFVEGRGKTAQLAYFQESDPAKIPWSRCNADIVAECSGAFKSRSDLEKHLAAGAKKVIVSAPAEGADFHMVFGVNHRLCRLNEHRLISSSSCTTNCLAPIVKVLRESFGIQRGFMTTIHSYTNDQKLLDSSHKKDFRRARAAALNMIPTSTGAGRALAEIFPDLRGKIEGMAVRAPCPNVSLADLTVETKKPASAESLAQRLRQASEGELKNILAVEEKPLVSSDFIGRFESAIVDLPCLKVLDGRLIKILAWYDNESGFAQRIIDLLLYMQSAADQPV